MNPNRLAKPPRRWTPKLIPLFTALIGPYRRMRAKRECGLIEYDIRGAEIVRDLINEKNGVLITPNHPSHADAYAMSEAGRKARTSFYYMATWNVFENTHLLGRGVLQASGVFSIDRDGVDRQAFKTAREILVDKKHPLVIFPEGEVYHCNDRVTPFREGAVAIALSAARKANRKLFMVPTAIKHEFIEAPSDELDQLMSEVETSIHWRPRPKDTIQERIYAAAGALMSLKELEYLGEVQSGDLPSRTENLSNLILKDQELRFEINSVGRTIPERVKELRRRHLKTIELDGSSEQVDHDLDDLFLAIQLFSYPGNYVSENPSVERIAETLDKFEEDVLLRKAPTSRGTKKATVRFGAPIEVPVEKRAADVEGLTNQLEAAVQAMLDNMDLDPMAELEGDEAESEAATPPDADNSGIASDDEPPPETSPEPRKKKPRIEV